jgi:uncharacterized membrane protein YdfJ with MMPL/SSD domain
VRTYLVGQPAIWAGMQALSKRDLDQAEASGFPLVGLILLVVFGSLAAAALPLALGFVSVILTGALIYLISLQMTTSVFVTKMASMIGVGVAIAIDATLVRLILVSAATVLMGRWNWWMPSWLARVLPDLSFDHRSPAATGPAEA